MFFIILDKNSIIKKGLTVYQKWESSLKHFINRNNPKILLLTCIVFLLCVSMVKASQHISISLWSGAHSPYLTVALTDRRKVSLLSEFICLSILALTFSELFPRAARFSRVDRKDDWRHYRAAPTAPQPIQSTHRTAHTDADDSSTQGAGAHTSSHARQSEICIQAPKQLARLD